VAIETRYLLYSVISVGAVGFLLSIVFLFLSAPDLAITQIAVEVVTLVLLLRATIRSERNVDSDQKNYFGKLMTLAMVTVLAVISARIFVDFPELGRPEFPEFGRPVTERFADAPSNTYLRNGLEETGAANIVTAVLLDYRAYDTLGEATILFCAVMGALTILRKKAKKEPDEPDHEEDET
jgi:multisubunit Na+/H+ antiporter MnhB subunit